MGVDMGKKPVNVEKNKQGFQPVTKGKDNIPTASSMPKVTAASTGVSPTAGMSSSQINSLYEAFQADRLAAERRPEVDRVLSEQQVAAQAELAAAQLTREQREMERIHRAYDAIPESERPTLTDEQFDRVRPGLGDLMISADMTREEQTRVLVGLAMTDEINRARYEKRPLRSASEVMAEVADEGGIARHEKLEQRVAAAAAHEIEQMEVERIHRTYDAIPESERPTLTDEQFERVRHGLGAGWILRSGAKTREEKTRVLVGLAMRREKNRAEYEKRPARSASEVMAEVAERGGI
jgi:hypothetical protein